MSTGWPRLRLVASRELRRILATQPYADVWPVLDGNLEADLRARLVQHADRSWRFTIGPDEGDYVFDVRLTRRLGAVFAAAANGSEQTSADDLVDWLDTHPAGWRPPDTRGNDARSRRAAVRSAVSALRTALSSAPSGLERFLPAQSGYCAFDVEVDLGRGVPMG